MNGVTKIVSVMTSTTKMITCSGNYHNFEPRSMELSHNCGPNCRRILSTLVAQGPGDFQISKHRLGVVDSGVLALCKLVYKNPAREVPTVKWNVADIVTLTLSSVLLVAHMEIAFARFI